jgi:hypothetical protein
MNQTRSGRVVQPRKRLLEGKPDERAPSRQHKTPATQAAAERAAQAREAAFQQFETAQQLVHGQHVGTVRLCAAMAEGLHARVRDLGLLMLWFIW